MPDAAPRSDRRAPAAGLLLLVLLAAAGCAKVLAPAPGAFVVPGPGRSALGRAADVSVVASAGAWNGFPRSLGAVVTPVLVTIDNTGSVPLRIRHEDFSLESRDGRVFGARRPFEVTGVVAETPPAGYALPRFGVGFGWGRSFGWSVGVGYPFFWDPFWDDYFYPMYVNVRLPTGDMVQKALPETVVEPQERVSGFLYFDRVRDVDQVDFVARLVDARTGAEVGVVVIPFQLE